MVKMYSGLPREYQEELREQVAKELIPVMWSQGSNTSHDQLVAIVDDAFYLAEIFLEKASKVRQGI